MPIVEKMYITEIDKCFDGDIFFPQFEEENFIKTIDERIEGEIPYTYVTYTKR